jgi:hypothetical protein
MKTFNSRDRRGLLSELDQRGGLAMPDDDNNPEKIKQFWEERLKSGAPIQSYVIDAPMTVRQDQDGGLLVDCPTVHLMGFDRAGIVRIRIAPAAMRPLFDVLTEIQNAGGLPEPTGPSRATQ